MTVSPHTAAIFYNGLGITNDADEQGWSNLPLQGQEEFIRDLTETIESALGDDALNERGQA